MLTNTVVPETMKVIKEAYYVASERDLRLEILYDLEGVLVISKQTPDGDYICEVYLEERIVG